MARGFFEKLVNPLHDYQNVAMEAKEYVTSLSVVESERNIAKEMGLELHRLIAERQRFLTALTVEAFNDCAWKTDHVKVKGACFYLNEYLEKHFRSLPGVDSEYGYETFLAAKRKYSIVGLETHAMTVLQAVTGLEASKEDVGLFPEFVQLIEKDYRKVCVTSAYRQMALLANVEIKKLFGK